MPSCKFCNDDHYILHGCCGGNMCGCMGMPVLMENCTHCNPNGDKEPNGSAEEYADKVEYRKVEPRK